MHFWRDGQSLYKYKVLVGWGDKDWHSLTWWSLHKYKVLVGWRVKARVQISRRKFHTYIHLNYSRVEFLSCIYIYIKEHNNVLFFNFFFFFFFDKILNFFFLSFLSNIHNNKKKKSINFLLFYFLVFILSFFRHSNKIIEHKRFLYRTSPSTLRRHTISSTPCMQGYAPRLIALTPRFPSLLFNLFSLSMVG